MRNEDSSASASHIMPRGICEKSYLTLVIVILGALVLILGVAYTFHWFGLGLSADAKAKQEVADVVSAVSKHILVPQDDTPVLARVTDAAKLAGEQPFFAHTANGDELLLFPKSAQAILYSPSRDLIVNVGPIQYDNNQQQQVPAASQQPSQPQSPVPAATSTVSVEVRNGSGKSGLAAAIAGRISALPGMSVASATDVARTNYAKTIIVDRSRSAASTAAAHTLADTFNATNMASLPAGERASTADVVILLGADQAQ